MDRFTLITLIIALVGCSLAVAIERIKNLPFISAQWMALVWGIVCVTSFQLQYDRLPPLPFTSAALDAEPWEMIVWPLLAICCLWPMLRRVTANSWQWRMTFVVCLAAMTLVLALARADRFAALHVGNMAWTSAALVTLVLNYLAIEWFSRSGAGRWCLLVLLAQLLTATALVMTCYGSWGDWCKQASLALALICFARLLVPLRQIKLPEANEATSDTKETWSISLALPVLVSCAAILMHIRDYSQIALPTWLAPAALLMPTLIGVVDFRFGVHQRPGVRIATAAVLATLLSGGILAIVLAQSSAEESW